MTNLGINNLAVYGTLRKNFGNHHFLGRSKFIGKGKTIDKYTLTASGIPFVHKDPLHNVVVEVYNVDTSDFERIDRLEGHPNWYKREIIEVEVDGEVLKAWLYFYPDKASIIETGDYADYTKYR